MIITWTIRGTMVHAALVILQRTDADEFNRIDAFVVGDKEDFYTRSANYFTHTKLS